MANAGEIVVEFIFDDKGVPVAVKRVSVAMDEVQKAMVKTAASVKTLENAQVSLGRKFHDIVATLGYLRFTVMDINDVFVRLPVAIMKTAGELERTRALLGGLSKEMTKAARDAEGAANFNYITKMAQQAPFEIAALSDSFVKLKSGGIDPAKGSLQALVDGVARFGGNGETMKRASVAIQQMMGKGVVSMEELRQQLGEAVPSAMRDMATGMGLSMAALTKAVSKGTVEASDAINKMLVIMGMRNEGAAKEMMQTWVGLQAQIKTRMALAAEEVANAGFGPAMKKVVSDVSEALRGMDFKRFTDSFGRGLGSAITTLSDFSKTLIAHSDMIMAAASAFIYYKAAALFVGPALDAMSSGIKKVTNEFALQTRMQTNSGEVHKAMSLANLRSIEAEALAQTTASAQKIAALKAEMVQLEANRLALISQRSVASAALLSGRNQDTGRFISKDVIRQQIADIDRLGMANGAAMVKMKGDIAAVETAYRNSSHQVVQQGQAIDTLKNTVIQTTPHMNAMTTATNLAKGAFLALGGWATVLNLALAAGIYTWMNWGKAGKEAIEQVRRAKLGLANQDDMDAIAGREKNARKKRDDLQAELDRQVKSRTSNQRLSNAELQQQINEQDAIIEKESEAKWQAKAAIDKENSRQVSDRMVSAADDAVAVVRGTTQKKISAIDAAYASEIAAAAGNQAKVDAAEKSRGDAMKSLAKSAKQETIDALNKQVKELESQYSGANGNAAVQAVEQVREKLQNAKNELANAMAMGENKFIIKKSEGGKEHTSPIQKFLQELKVEEASLEAQLPGLLSSVGKVDHVATALATARAKLAGKGMVDHIKGADGKSGNVAPSSKEKEEVERLVVKNARMLDLTTDLKAIDGRLLSMAPEHRKAMAIFADPLGYVDLKKEDGFEKLLSKLRAAPATLEEIAKKVGTTSEGMLAKLEEGAKQAAEIDLSATFEKVADENHKMSLSIIEDDRQRVRLQMVFDNQLAASRLQKSIDAAQLARADAKLIEQLEQQKIINAEYRAEQLRQATRTPLEKLADDWQRSLNAMDDASAKWAGGFVDMIVNSAKTGKLEFGSFVESVLADILKIEAQKTLGDPLRDLIKGGTDWLKGKMPNLGSNSRGSGLDAAGGAEGGAAAAAAAGVSMQQMAAATDIAQMGLKTMTDQGVNAATTSLIQSVAQQGAETLTANLFTASLMTAASAASAFAASMAASAANAGGGDILGSFISIMGFADGGIMSGAGAVPLRKYAAGGIANSPQMALYGEGSMNEAYVPLPDGRRIPVAMQGQGAGAAPSVTVNVINQSGSPVTAQQGQPRFDGKQMILDVVLTAVNQPGGFRDGMKGALR